VSLTAILAIKYHHLGHVTLACHAAVRLAISDSLYR